MEKKVKFQSREGDPGIEKRKGKKKRNAAEESTSNRKTDESVAFINSNCVAFIQDSSGATVIIDTGASCHIDK